jgi:hypothetical protein
MKAFAVCSALLIAAGVADAATDPPSPDVAVFSKAITIPAEEGAITASLGTIPAGKRLVVQSVAFLRGAGIPVGSSAHVYFTSQINGVVSRYALPSVSNTGEVSPGVFAAVTFYANAGTEVTATIVRTGDETNEEVDFVTVTGYYASP